MSPLMVANKMGVKCPDLHSIRDSIQLLLEYGAEPNGPESVRKNGLYRSKFKIKLM